MRLKTNLIISTVFLALLGFVYFLDKSEKEQQDEEEVLDRGDQTCHVSMPRQHTAVGPVGWEGEWLDRGAAQTIDEVHDHLS